MSGKHCLILCESILCIQKCLKLKGKKRDQHSIVAIQAFNSAAHVGVHGLPFLSDLACSISALALVCNIEHEHSKPKNYSNKQAKIKEAWGIEVSDDNVCLGPEILVKGSLSSPGISLKTHLSGVNSSIGTASFFASSPPYTLSSWAFVVLAATNNWASSKSSALESN